MSTHTAYIETDPQEGHYARCSCGWESRPQTYLEKTVDDLENHELGVALECMRCGEEHEYDCERDDP